jgi:hypothetical protein
MSNNDQTDAQFFARDKSHAGPQPEHGVRSSHRQRIIPWKKFISALIPNWLLSRCEISQGAKLCYARLAQYAGKEGRCFPKQRTLAAELGVSERMARKYIKELTAIGLREQLRLLPPGPIRHGPLDLRKVRCHVKLG